MELCGNICKIAYLESDKERLSVPVGDVVNLASIQYDAIPELIFMSNGSCSDEAEELSSILQTTRRNETHKALHNCKSIGNAETFQG